jgi:glycosyltransferase involved in cell wall biosynthesis
MTDGIVLTIVVPAYNEGDNLGIVLDDALATLNMANHANPYEIIVVDDGSTDDTATVADDYACRFSTIRVFRHIANQGMGTALRTGYTASRGEFVTFLPADGQVKADQAIALLRLAKDADLVTTTRLGCVQENQIKSRSSYREFLTWGMHICLRVCLGIYPKHFTGLYMIRGSFLRSLPLCARTACVGMEIYLWSLRRMVRMRHGEMVIRPRLSGHSKVARVGGLAREVWELLHIRWNAYRYSNVNLTPPQSKGSIAA